MNDDDLDRALERLGDVIPPPPDAVTVARIELELRGQHGRSRARRGVVWPVLTGVAAAVVLGLVLVSTSAPSAPVDATGVAGRGDAVDGGPADDLDPATPTSTTQPGADGRSEDPTRPDPADDESAGPDDEAPPATGRDGEAPSTTTPPDATTTTNPVPPPSISPSDSRPKPAPLRAKVVERDGRAVITWEAPTREVSSWSIVRERRDGVARILRSDDPGLRRHVDDPPDLGEVRYVVRGHGADGAIVVQSEDLTLKR